MKKILLTLCSLVIVGAGCVQSGDSQSVTTVSFDQRAKCEEMGSRFKQNYESKDTPGTFFSSIYGYSAARRTCLYSSIHENGDTMRGVIVDLLTNQEIFSYMMLNGKIVAGDEAAFSRARESFEAELRSQIEIK